MDKRSPKAQVLTDVMLMIFQLNGRLLDKGDELVASLGINSARWQLLGPVYLAGKPLTAPQIAHAMGISRQGAQKQLNKMVSEGFFIPQVNLSHERSPLYALTEKGQYTITEAMSRQTEWATLLTEGMAEDDLTHTLNLLSELHQRLASTALTQGI
jgi:DNA-binding MarR family transcriptional regulator